MFSILFMAVLAFLLCANIIMICYIFLNSWIIGVVGAVIILLVTVIDSLKKRYNTRCPNCKTKYSFDEDVDYSITASRSKTHTISPNNQSRKAIEEEEFNTYRFDCTCPKCGKKHSFNREYRISVCYADGSYEQEDAEKSMREYFQSKQKIGCLLLLAGLLQVGIFLFCLNALSPMLFN